MGSLATLPVFGQTTSFRSQATDVWQNASGSVAGSVGDFDTLVRIHRAGAAPEVVDRLPRVVFRVLGTESPSGVRYILWWPVVELLMPEIQSSRTQWVETWICSNEIAIAYLPKDVAALVDKLRPELERARVRNPFLGRSSALRVAATAFELVAFQLSLEGDPDAQRLTELRRQLVDRARGAANRTGTLQDELRTLSSQAPAWAIKACVGLLRQASGPPTAYQDDCSPLELAFASEASLAADWLRPEEEEAWKNL